MKTLHVIKDPEERWAWEAAAADRRAGHEPAVLLWQDGVLARRGTDLPVYASLLDLQARGIERVEAKIVSDREIVDLFVAVDRVTTW